MKDVKKEEKMQREKKLYGNRKGERGEQIQMGTEKMDIRLWNKHME